MSFLRRILPLFLVLVFFAQSSYAYQQIEFIREIGEAGKKARGPAAA